MNWGDRLKGIDRAYSLVRILSLDVAIGAICSASMVVWWYKVEMPWAWWYVLPLSVWLIYTLDHLLDANRLGAMAHTPRHRFHYQYRAVLWIVWGIIFCLCGYLGLWHLPVSIWYFGGFMCWVVLVHLGLVWLAGNDTNGVILKEFGVGIIYASGVWGGPVIIAWPLYKAGTTLLFAEFYALALLNLLCFSILEAKIDEQSGQTSFVRAIGIKRAVNVFWGLVFVVFLLMVINLTVLWSIEMVFLQLVYTIMASVIAWVYLNRPWFEKAERYRTAADAVFCLPVMVWLMSG